MNIISALHVHFEGLTASFRHPLTISGGQISTPQPSYSNLLGIISACAGYVIKPKDTKLGFEFYCNSFDHELERSARLVVDEKGNLKPHPKGQGIYSRQVYWRPRLDLYLTNTSFKKIFESPVSTPCFGRSQDIAWITFVKEIELEQKRRGRIRPTLLPDPIAGFPGLVLRLPEYIDNSKKGYTRKPTSFGMYQAIPPTVDQSYPIERDHLYHPSDSVDPDHVIYLYQWLLENE
jgi:CRISPR-associated protein Cas5t